MFTIHKKIVSDELNKPVAVQIDYSDWLEIEKILGLKDQKPSTVVDLTDLYGTITFPEDPLEYQQRIREEWP